MLAKRLEDSSYTVFVNSNDPGTTEKELHEYWFQEALERIKSEEKKRAISVNLRYAPLKDKDDLPVDLVHRVLLLGRFMYEHLFPVPPSDTSPIFRIPPRA